MLFVPAIILFVVAAAIGWRRAARRGGETADKLMYAFAHGVPAFLAGLVGFVIAIRLNFFG